MNLKTRVERLENLIGIENEIPPLILIKVKNQQKGSQDRGTLGFAVIPGPSCGKHGETLTRDAGESEKVFLKRCNTQYAEIYT